MGIKKAIKRIGAKTGDKVAQLSSLSPVQVENVQLLREQYLLEMPDPNDSTAQKQTERLMAASSIEIFNAYLPQIKDLYLPVNSISEYGKEFDDGHNIRYINITKWVTDKSENSLEKLVNVYAVLSDEDCNIALIFDRKQNNTNVFLAIVNNDNAASSTDVDNYKEQIIGAIRGNFPGAEWTEPGLGVLPFFDNSRKYSVSTASNIPTEKSEKFVSQTIEKLIDGIIPETKKQEYTIILLATPILDVEDRKLRLGEFYSGLAPYSSWSTSFQRTENKSLSSSAVVGVNVGASAGIQNVVNQSFTKNNAVTDNETMTDSKTESDTYSQNTSRSEMENRSHSSGTNESVMQQTGSSDTAGGSAGVGVPLGPHADINYSHGWNESSANTIGKTATDTLSKGLTNTVGESIGKTTGRTVANTLGKAITRGMAATSGVSKTASFGGNIGANFARSSTTTAMLGKNEGITQNYTNFNVQHALELLKEQMKRFEQSSALGMWDFAAYILSEDPNVTNNVAHSYLALTLGEESFMSKSAINTWRGNIEEEAGQARAICEYLKTLRHPIFGLNPGVVGKVRDDEVQVEVDEETEFILYPPIITATTSLSGKELAYSLNFPQKSIAGLPVLECAEFGRNIVTYEDQEATSIHIGKIFHMNHTEPTRVELTQDSITSHVFITGSTGSGKSNTIFTLLEKLKKKGIKFLVIEPAKGEYKNIFGACKDVSVLGTNPDLSELLRLNPFSFSARIHVLEHLDRLVEVFNVCWPMYAAMPAVLKNAIEKSYEDCGWDLTQSVNPYGENLYPGFNDIIRNVKTIIDTSEYDSENKGAYKGSLLTRLESLTNGINGLIFVQNEVPEQNLFDENVIIDLSRVGSSETKSLIMGMLVLKLQEYRITKVGQLNSSLKHVTVLEEAHNILKRTSTETITEGANLIGKSVEMIANAIAEMRTFGEGFLIADQAPGLLDSSVIRNTNTKIIMRLPDQSDRILVGKAANLNDDQIVELAKLPRGVAAIYQNEWVQPVLCKIEKYRGDTDKYYFNPTNKSSSLEVEDDSLFRIKIASLVSKGTSLGREIIMSDIRQKLAKAFIDASVQVKIMKRLARPAHEIRMTDYAIIASALFPEVKEAVKNAHIEGYSEKEWTLAAETALSESLDVQISEQVRRDIIQGIITYYFLNEVNSQQALEDWRIKGELR